MKELIIILILIILITIWGQGADTRPMDFKD